jgi:hypothetical protein
MFSELVDECVTLSKKLNLRESHIIPYLNATIRECQTKEFFYRDRVEDQIAITTEPSFIWDRPTRIRQIESVQYPYSEGYSLVDCPIYTPRKTPGRINPLEDIYFYYGGPTYYVFNGVIANTTINISYFAYSRRFKYYEAGSRPAVYDFDSETWDYPLGATTDAEKEAARDLVWHWLFEAWYEMVKQGTLAKTYKDVEDVRAPATFAMFSGQLKTFQASEPKEGSVDL